MTTEIICEFSTDKLKKLSNDLEKNGFVPISMTSEVEENRNLTCLLMHKKE